jgi:hypothetical protein
MAGNAEATLIFDLTAGNPSISGYPGPYATVTINVVDTTHATITFTGHTFTYTDPYTHVVYTSQYRLGDGSTAALNVMGTYDGSANPANNTLDQSR